MKLCVLNKINYFVIPLLLMSILSACSDNGGDIENDPETIKLGRTSIVFKADQLSPEVCTINTNVVSGFSVEPLESDWFTVVKREEGILITPKSVNSDQDNQRAGSLTITAGKAVETLELVQLAASETVEPPVKENPYLNVDEAPVVFDYGKDIIPVKVSVSTNIQEGYQINNTAPGWILITDKQDDGFYISVNEYDGYRDRTANLQVVAGEFLRTVNVSQRGSGQAIFNFVQVGDYDTSNLPWEGITNGSLKFVEDGNTDYDGEYKVDVQRWSGAGSEDFDASIDWGRASLGEDVNKRYLKISLGRNTTREFREAAVTIAAAEYPEKTMTLQFRQEKYDEDLGRLIAQIEFNMYFDQVMSTYFPGQTDRFKNHESSNNFIYNEDEQTLKYPLNYMGSNLWLTLEIREGEIYTAHDYHAGILNLYYDVYQWVYAVDPDDNLVRLDDQAAASTKWEYSLEGDEIYLKPSPIIVDGKECKPLVTILNTKESSNYGYGALMNFSVTGR